MEEIRLTSHQELDGAIDSLKEELRDLRSPIFGSASTLFRGQANATWRLDTTLERYRPGELPLLAYNRYLVRIHPAIESYTGKSWPLEREPTLDQDFLLSPPSYELMVYVRHHGFPSPLLDWTRSPYIALFFAYLNSVPGADVAVYAYVSAPTGAKGGSVGSPTIAHQGPYATTHPRHYIQQAEYTVCAHQPEDRGKWIYCSHHLVFDGGDDTQDLLRKFVLPQSERLAVLERLDAMNINPYTLFATEDALMQMLAFREITFRS